MKEIISDPAVGNFLFLVIGLALIKLNERKSSAVTEDKNKYCSSLIISHNGRYRKVGE